MKRSRQQREQDKQLKRENQAWAAIQRDRHERLNQLLDVAAKARRSGDVDGWLRACDEAGSFKRKYRLP